jgi:uncharacterized membrane protein
MKKLLISLMFVFLLAFATVSAAEGDFTVDFDALSKAGDLNTDVSFTATFANTGGVLDIVAINTISTVLTNTEDGSTIPAPTVSSVSTLLLDGTTQDVLVTVSIPSDAYRGTYEATLTSTNPATAFEQTIDYTVDVNVVDGFSTDVDGDITMTAGETKDKHIEVTNTGSTNLESWSISFTSDDGESNHVVDNDDDRVDLSYSFSADPLAPGASKTFTVEFDADSSIDEGEYRGDITIRATGDGATSTEQVVTLQTDVSITPAICEDGKAGNDFDINIEEPESNDDFQPGDTITVEVDIENRDSEDLDIVIEVILYNEDEGDFEETVKQDESLDEDESETFRIDIDLPSNLDEDDTFYIYVQVHEEHEEDNSCDYERVKLDIELEDEAAKITDFTLSPVTPLMCGDNYQLTFEIESTGKDELENVYVEIVDGDLDISEESENFDLGDHDDSDNDYVVSFDLTVPEGTPEGGYYIEAILHKDSGSSLDNELILVDVVDCTDNSVAAKDSLKVTIADSFDVTENELTLSFVVENDGSETKDIEVTVEEVSWATVEGIEHLESLAAGSETHAYVYLSLDSTTYGKHDLKVTVSDDVGNEVDKIVTVDFGEAPAVKEKQSFGFGSSEAFWIIADVVLVILAIAFLRMLFSRK